MTFSLSFRVVDPALGSGDLLALGPLNLRLFGTLNPSDSKSPLEPSKSGSGPESMLSVSVWLRVLFRAGRATSVVTRVSTQVWYDGPGMECNLRCLQSGLRV